MSESTGHRPPPAATRPKHFEPHIQGLRAIAVILVVLYHFWPGRLSGGYVGVDIFFVISGFLITGQLARELESTGRIALPSFWAKRARRLLPAALLVLAFSVLATLFLLPLSSLGESLREILASVFYVENWALAASSVDYLAAHDATLVQHYWSLAVEEQFYIVWPLLLLGATWLGAKFFAGRRWLPLILVVALVTAASLVVSVVYTQSNPAEAFFATFTRGWEFGVGAVLALLPRLRPRGAWWPNLIGYAGLLLVLGSAYFYGPDTAFPGYAAILPVLGAAAIIVSARAEHWWDIGNVLGGAPQRFIGDISYSVYLWHWPLIIVAPYIPGWGLEGWNRVVLFLASFLLGWLTKRFVEDPARGWRFLTTRKPRVTYGFVLGAMGVVALLVAGTSAIQQPKYEAAASELAAIAEDPPQCFGAQSGQGCENPELATSIIPSPGFGNADKPGHVECFVQLNESRVKACTFGEDGGPRVALIGDSHAYQYIEAVIDLAEQNGWQLTTYLKGACPWTTAQVGGPSSAFTDSCAAWQRNLEGELERAEPFDAVSTAALAATPYVDASADEIAEGFQSAWAQADGAPIVTVVDNPDFAADPNKCLRTSDPDDCTEARDDVLVEVDPIGVAAKSAGATLLDLSETYCDEDRCFSVIGGANVYRDQDHLTVTWTRTMQPRIGSALEEAMTR
jgi:peptidoglycan/LPS O-acetylase OafA/YrhL